VGLEHRGAAGHPLELEARLAYARKLRALILSMQKKYLLEISVETVEAALAAERGGADRIELCADLSVGGVTPSTDLMGALREQLQIPIFMMIRPRGGDFAYSDAELAAMKTAIASAKKLGIDGVVLGILRQDRRVDVHRTCELVELARPLPATFHRAFDKSADLRQAFESVVQTGAKRILTSGGAKNASEGATMLAELVATARDRIHIVPGAGINASNIAHVVKLTGAREFHSGLSSALPYASRDFAKFETEVRKLAEALSRLP
jgi:copper homeostasis protein